MAKKHKRAHKKPLPPKEPSPFWAFAIATILCLVALFLVLGGLGTGGPLPTGLFGGTYAIFGWAAWLVPLALVYWGVAKAISEDHRLSFGKFAGMFSILLFSSGLLSACFAIYGTGHH